MKINILTVSLNAGVELLSTVNSVLEQEEVDYELIIKDGGSKDGSLEQLPQDDRIQICISKDSGIYDAMNQAKKYMTGDFALYLNCGDVFYDAKVLKSIVDYIDCYKNDKSETIYYADCYTVNRKSLLCFPRRFNDFVCFTTTLCHQATIYPQRLLKERDFLLDYKVAADFEYYVHAYCNGYSLKHIPCVVVKYKGNGASETSKNRKLGIKEANRALKSNFNKHRYYINWIKMQLCGIGIKRILVQSELLYPFYSKIAEIYYSIFAKREQRRENK